jgi:hypothetical protein
MVDGWIPEAGDIPEKSPRAMVLWLRKTGKEKSIAMWSWRTLNVALTELKKLVSAWSILRMSSGYGRLAVRDSRRIQDPFRREAIDIGVDNFWRPNL